MGSLWSTFVSDDVRNAFVMGGVVIALLSLKNTVELAKKKQSSSDLVFAGRNDKAITGGIFALNKILQGMAEHWSSQAEARSKVSVPLV